MLSRSAERVYWTGRYLERAENSARIVQQYSHLLLDLPAEVGMTWSELVRVVGAAEPFDASGAADTEQAVLHFLLAKPDTTSSLLACIRIARENVRNTRDLLPSESWESVNELYRFAFDSLDSAVAGGNRFDVLDECIGRCQQVNGSLVGTMSHHSPYHFLRLGQSLERADMTTRVIDVAAAYIQQNERLVRRYGSTLWTNVLKSVSAFQMYRQYRQPQVVGIEVIDFLLRDSKFPRAVQFCLAQAATSSRALPNSAEVLSSLETVMAELGDDPQRQQGAERVAEQMDRLQQGLDKIHRDLINTWFLPEHRE